ncbi:MAG: tol-pal system protein YbgF [Deltaproteobacteria bacterium]|nr:tol-pal system protein YbgF [Deltaproteobacteria bacterium]
MRFRPSILCVLAALSISGCAALDREKADSLVRDVDNLKTSLVDTNSRIERLSTKLSLLQEKVEQYEAAGKERLSAMPAAPPEGLRVVPLGDDAATKAQDAKASSAEGPGPQSPAGADSGKEAAQTPDALYRKGHEFLAAGNLAGARMVFLKIADRFPDYVLVDNALYWAAETYYTERDFTRAIAGFKEVERKYPNRNKAPDAVLKIGLAYMETGDIERGREYLDKVMKKYPGSEAADTAKKTVDKMADKRVE